MEFEGSHFSTGGHFSPCQLLGVMRHFLQTKNDPSDRRKWTPVTFLRQKMTGGRFSMGSLFIVTTVPIEITVVKTLL